jgi:enolase
VNTPERKFAQIGVNVDAQNSYLTDQDRYEFEGPKTLFDSNLLTEWLCKMVADHPLLTYIEDPCAQGDINSYQRLVPKLKEKKVQVAVKGWFGSDLEAIKKHTQIISPDTDSENEEAKEKPETPEVPPKVEEPEPVQPTPVA